MKTKQAIFCGILLLFPVFLLAEIQEISIPYDGIASYDTVRKLRKIKGIKDVQLWQKDGIIKISVDAKKAIAFKDIEKTANSTFSRTKELNLVITGVLADPDADPSEIGYLAKRDAPKDNRLYYEDYLATLYGNPVIDRSAKAQDKEEVKKPRDLRNLVFILPESGQRFSVKESDKLNKKEREYLATGEEDELTFNAKVENGRTLTALEITQVRIPEPKEKDIADTDTRSQTVMDNEAVSRKIEYFKRI